MPNDEQFAILIEKGVDAWNAWRRENRRENRDIRPDLRKASLGGADLSKADFCEADFSGADLRKANLSGAILTWATLSQQADLREADLREADLSGADLRRAKLNGADLRGAKLRRADLRGGVDLCGADLREADLLGADMIGANLQEADLRAANLTAAYLGHANLQKADLRAANLAQATLVQTDLTGADLTGCRIYGISAWDLKLEGAKQQNLVITRETEPEITVDDIEVAQFVYLMLNNQKIRNVIDTITSKAVLILGRFTTERKKVLDGLRDELRKRNYLPILFDFELPAKQNITETVTLLARMARFIIADLTDPSSIPQELQAIIPSVRVPVKPLLLKGSSLYSMFKDFDPRDFHWVLPVYRYKEPEQLLATLAKNVIAPAEKKAEALEKRRRKIEAELTKPQRF
jgi:uncharacterized protein YjbI with pentapeptide repeats